MPQGWLAAAMDGRQRRAWLDRQNAALNEGLAYWMGPAAQPLTGMGHLAAMMSPGADMMDMVQSGGDLMKSRTPLDAAQNAGWLGAATLGMALPGSAGKMRDAVREKPLHWKDVKDAIIGNDDVFVRWSAGPQHDLRPGAVSRDYQTGEAHAGLSAMRIPRENTTDAEIMRALRSYDYLTDINRGPTRGHLYRGREIGRDTDNASSIVPEEYLGTISEDLHRSIGDDAFVRQVELKNEIEDFRRALEYYKDNPIPFGSPYSQEKLRELEAELAALMAGSDH